VTNSHRTEGNSVPKSHDAKNYVFLLKTIASMYDFSLVNQKIKSTYLFQCPGEKSLFQSLCFNLPENKLITAGISFIGNKVTPRVV
jgi:hypothetical protein